MGLFSSAKSVLGAANKAIGSPLGGALGEAAGAWWATEQNKQSAKNQMQFQKQMSNTAYQRVMNDMRKAGLNPILAAKLGPASTPGGAAYNVGRLNLPDAVSSGFQNKLQENQAEKIEEEIEQVRATIENLKAKTQKTKAEEILTDYLAISERIKHPGMRQQAIEAEWRQLTQKEQLEVVKRLAQESKIIADIIEEGPGSWLPAIRYIFGGMPNVQKFGK